MKTATRRERPSLLGNKRPSGFWLLGFLCLELGCNWRKPLPRGKDAGPPVEVVDARPRSESLGRNGLGTTNLYDDALLIDEHEPNDDREHAQPLALLSAATRGIRGSLAPPTTLGAGKGADDFYLLTVGAGAGPQQLRIELASSPQADVYFDLYGIEAAGASFAALPAPFAHIDERGRGEAERLSLGVRPVQTLLVRVRGNVAATTPGPEPFAYKLVIRQAPSPLGYEVEPNETPEQATLATAADLSGTLAWRGDEDFWALNLVDALYRRFDTAKPAAPRPPGLKEKAILRIELRTPGATPALRLLIEPETLPGPDGGAAGFRKMQFVLDIAAPKGEKELRLRNVGLPAGSARAYVGVRGLPPTAASKVLSDVRYQLRLSVEPELEGAESEPNDDCAQATLLARSAQESGPTEETIAGFLFPGDSDCFRIRAAASPRRHDIRLILPGAGSSCRAELEWVKSDGVERAASPDGGTTLLLLRARGDALLRVHSRDHKTCFDEPYRLLVRSEPDRP